MPTVPGVPLTPALLYDHMYDAVSVRPDRATKRLLGVAVVFLAGILCTIAGLFPSHSSFFLLLFWGVSLFGVYTIVEVDLFQLFGVERERIRQGLTFLATIAESDSTLIEQTIAIRESQNGLDGVVTGGSAACIVMTLIHLSLDAVLIGYQWPLVALTTAWVSLPIVQRIRIHQAMRRAIVTYRHQRRGNTP